MALSLNIPREEMNSSTPETSPRVFCLTRSISERFGTLTLSPRSMSSPGSPWKSQQHGNTPSSPSFNKSGPGGRLMLQRFHTSSPRTPSTPILRSPASLRSTIGTNWTRAIVDLYQSQEPDEMLESLEEIKMILRQQQQKESNMKFCKKDLEAALNEKKRRIPLLFTPQVRRFALNLFAEFFDKDYVNKLPSAVLTYAFGFLGAAQLGNVSAVCTNWGDVVCTDAIWKPIYIKRFHFLDPREAIGVRRFKDLFKERLLDPHIGDLVEVAWKGKFRLESLDIYQGLAWWSAIVVDKSDGSKYKIHYPGWDSRWDEWVHRDRLRWTVEQDLGTRICPNDDVEIWCCGSNVPGAWLEAKVRKVKGSKYCVGRVLSSGALWVDRERVRMSPKGARSLAGNRRGGPGQGGSFFSREAGGMMAGVSSSCSMM